MPEGIDSVGDGAIQVNLSDEQHWPEMAGTICPRCETPVGASARFCLECGTMLRRAVRCIDCGSVLGPGVRYCDECGQRTI
jgi:hypothetical protein